MKQFWIHTKHKIARWLFADEVADITMERDSLAVIQRRYERLCKEVEEEKQNLNLVDIVREQMKGFNPQLLLDDSDLTDLMDGEELDGFLAKAKDLTDNIVLKKICEHIKRNQMQYSALESNSLEQLNFGRATINGVSLLEDELDSLVLLYEQRHAKEEDYDKHSAF